MHNYRFCRNSNLILSSLDQFVFRDFIPIKLVTGFISNLVKEYSLGASIALVEWVENVKFRKIVRCTFNERVFVSAL